MGRHSIPDPEDSPDEPTGSGDQYDPQYQDRYGSYGGHAADRPDDGYRDDYADDEYGGEYADDYQDDYQDDYDGDYDGDYEGEYAADEDEYRDDLAGDDLYRDEPTAATADPYRARPTRSEPAARSAFSDSGSGGHRNDGEWTGSHRTVTPGRRGVSRGVIAALVAVAVVIAGVIGWKFFGDVLSNRSEVAAGRCVQGEAQVAVLADPSIAEQIGKFASTFNETAGPVGDHCVVVQVQPADADAVVAGLTGDWPQDLGPKPAIWIPGSSTSSARVQAGDAGAAISSANSLVRSPVLLAVRPELKAAAAEQNWSTLPGLQANPTSLDELGLAGWGSLRLALPSSADASYLVAEAVAAASVPPGGPVNAGLPAVNTLRNGAPELDDDSAGAALDALLDADDPAAAAVHGVAVTEQQLIQRTTDLSDATSQVAAWLPPGPVPMADFPAVLLSGDWLESEQVTAASRFERFLREDAQQQELAAAGFRADGAEPPSNDVVNLGELSSTLSVGDDQARAALANGAAGAPTAGTTAAGTTAVSIMLDRSLNLPPVVAALKDRISALPDTAAVGLTTFDGAAGTTLVNVGLLSDDIDGQTRREVLLSTLDGVSPGAGGAVSFTTLRNVYGDAQTNFRPGQDNSVLVITSGPHTDQSLGSAGLQDLLRSSADPARPVSVDVINVGQDPDQATWQSVAQISAGTFVDVPASDSPEMTAALGTVLG